MICIHENGTRQVALLTQHVEGWRRRPGPATSPFPARARGREVGTGPPTSRTHRGAPAEDRRIADDGADGDSTEGHPGAKAQVDIRATIILDARRIRLLRDEGQGTGTIPEQAPALIVLHRQSVHERTAQAIEALAGDRLAEHYSELAHHYSHSDDTQQAVAYLQRAGQQAADRSAYGEAITHLTRGLELLPHLPDAPARCRHEIDLQIALGQVFTATKGQASPEMEHAFTRAQALCEQLGETAQLSEVLRGLRVMYVARGRLSKARELAEQLLSLAKGGRDAVPLAEAHEILGDVLFWLGEFSSARAHLEQGKVIADAVEASSAALHDRHYTGVRSRRYGAWTLWYLGYPDQALQLSHEAVVLAQERGSPSSLAWALFYAGILHCLRREAPAAQARAEAAMALDRQGELRGLLARGTRLRGWALAAQGQHADGFAQMHQGLTAFGVAGEAGLQPLFRALLAEMHARAGRATAGLGVLDEALA
jgi:tetratricopeptide (TPR) repeat protein